MTNGPIQHIGMEGLEAELQLGCGIEDNSKIIFPISQRKHML